MSGVKTVYISNGPANAYEQMFQEAGWKVVGDIDDADLVQFIGGADVNPSLYNRNIHRSTSISSYADRVDSENYNKAQQRGIPCAGICRGGQFLNVMNKGRLFQDVDGHIGSHSANLMGYDKPIKVSSTHHQMMIPHEDGIVLMSCPMIGELREEIGPSGQIIRYHKTKGDTEAVYYEETESLCFQPHPEFVGFEECRKAYFFLINNYLFNSSSDNIPAEDEIIH